jgi:hypothetical protein
MQDILEAKDEFAAWLRNGEVGISSKAIGCWILFGELDDRHGKFCYPYDPDDLNRCIKLLNRVPYLRERFVMMAAVCPAWARLVENWDAIEKCFLEEVGINWCVSHGGKKTYKMMSDAIYDKQAGGGE